MGFETKFVAPNYDYTGLYNTVTRMLTMRRIVLRFHTLVNGISIRFIAAEAALAVGLILIGPTKVRSRGCVQRAANPSAISVQDMGVTIVALTSRRPGKS